MKQIKKILILLCLTTILTSCAKTKSYISYTVYPIGYLIDRITGKKFETKSIQESSIVQTASILPEYKSILNDSYYFFHIGTLEPYLDIYMDEIKNTETEIVDLSTLNAIYDFKKYNVSYIDSKQVFQESTFYNSELFDIIDVNQKDLSLWIDPTGMISLAKTIFDTLAYNNVENLQEYKQNYDKLYNELLVLEGKFNSLVSKLKYSKQTLKFATMSATFISWQKSFGFEIYPICLSKYGTTPTEDQLYIIKNRLIEDGVKYIAYEPNMTASQLDIFLQLEKELNLTRINLNNISSLSQTQVLSGKDYMTLMYENLASVEIMINDVIQEETIDTNKDN